MSKTRIIKRVFRTQIVTSKTRIIKLEPWTQTVTSEDRISYPNTVTSKTRLV